MHNLLTFNALVSIFALAIASAENSNDNLLDRTYVRSCIVNDQEEKIYHYFDYEFEGFSEHGGHLLSSETNVKLLYCNHIEMSDKDKPLN